MSYAAQEAAIPKLIAELEKLRKQNEIMRSALEKIDSNWHTGDTAYIALEECKKL